MTNEKFEQLLQRALAPEIEDSELQFRTKKVRSFDMKTIYKITSVAACAALIIGVGVSGNVFLSNRTITKTVDSSAADSASDVDNTFVLKVGAEEITPNKGVPLSFINGSSASLGGSEDGGNVKYCISTAGFICEGEGVESVTYSINRGAFAVVEAHEGGGSLITSGTPYEGDTNFPGYWSKSLNKYDPDTIDIKYYSEYTLDYSSQQNDRLCINVCGEVFDEDIYNKVFDFTNTPEKKAEGNNELMKGVAITCTAHYADGTSESETVVIECKVMTIEELGYPIAPDDDPKRKEAVFVYKLN